MESKLGEETILLFNLVLQQEPYITVFPFYVYLVVDPRETGIQ